MARHAVRRRGTRGATRSRAIVTVASLPGRTASRRTTGRVEDGAAAKSNESPARVRGGHAAFRSSCAGSTRRRIKPARSGEEEARYRVRGPQFGGQRRPRLHPGSSIAGCPVGVGRDDWIPRNRIRKTVTPARGVNRSVARMMRRRHLPRTRQRMPGAPAINATTQRGLFCSIPRGSPRKR